MDQVTKAGNPSMSSVAEIRKRARESLDRGAVTAGYDADRTSVVKLLNEALATEIVCVLRYKRHYFMARGIHAESVATEFQEHADQEMQHADQIAQRIVQLQGEPDFRPDSLAARGRGSRAQRGG